MMKRTIALNWRMLKIYWYELPILLLVLLFIGWLASAVLIFPVAVVICLSGSISPFGGSLERKESIYLLQSLPLKRSHFVLGKFIISFLMMVGGLLVATLMMPLANILSNQVWNQHFELYFISLAASFLLFAIMCLIFIPFALRVAPITQTVLYYIYLIPMMIIGGLAGFMLAYFEEQIVAFLAGIANQLAVVGIMGILAIFILFVSYLLSVKIYEKRDF
jgi:hypothetical protein